MRLTVITLNRSVYGLRLLNRLQRARVPVGHVLVFTGTWRRAWRLLGRTARHMGWRNATEYAARHLWSKAESLGADWRGHRLERDYRRLARTVDYVQSPGSSAARHALERNYPDLCLLGQSGILPSSLLAIPRFATLNAHPGILPDYRGVDPWLWAVRESRFDKVGSTLHSVNAGIDTGPILQLRPYRWQGNETVDHLGELLYEDCLDLLAEACGKTWPGYLDHGIQQTAGKYCPALPPRLRAEAKQKLHEFLAGSTWRAPEGERDR